MKIKTLKAGTIVQMHGIPVELLGTVKAQTAKGNWGLIDSGIKERAKQMGRKGGLQTSEAKAAAVRANGELGGRPRKTPKAGTPSEPANAAVRHAAPASDTTKEP